MPRESGIEKRSCALMAQGGWLTPKMGWEGWPDRLIIWAPGQHFWVEFKQPGGTLTVAQKARIPRLRARGETVLIIDTLKDMKGLLEVFR